MSAAKERVTRIALTGGIATGKSYSLAKFAELGAATIDADVLARQAVAPGTSGFEAVRQRFGASMVSADGGLDREALGRVVFSDENARRALEAIVHPAVYSAIQRWFEAGRFAVGIADIPLLYETGREKDFDKVIVTACPPETQLERLMARPGTTREDALRRLAAQWPVAKKVALADYVIDTSGTYARTDEQIEAIWEELRAIPGINLN